MSHRFDESRPRTSARLDDNKYLRPQFRHTRHTYAHPSAHAHDNETGLNRQQSYRRPPSDYSRQAHHPQTSVNMYSSTKTMYPHLRSEPQRRHSHTAHSTAVARRGRHGSEHSDSEDDSDDSSPPPHARLSRSNKRNSTFPPSAYHSCHQKQLQPYQHQHQHQHQKSYIHPAIPPTSPMIESAPSSRHGHHSHQQQIITRSESMYEQPRYTYQPPKFEDPRPTLNSRADSWSYTSTAPSSYSRSSSKGPSSRRGSVSMPPPASRTSTGQASRNRAAGGAEGEVAAGGGGNGAWGKAKKMYHSKTATNTAELAMFGLLAISKAL